MNYLYQQGSESWVALPEGAGSSLSLDALVQDLRRRTGAVQTWFFDLDDNHAPSPAKFLVRRAAGTHHLSPAYLQWCLKTAISWVQKGKKAESGCWEAYKERFLGTPQAEQELPLLLSLKRAGETLYPGVREFCSLVAGAERYYVTKNIPLVAELYATMQRFDGYFADAARKERAVEQYLVGHPWIERYGVDGDSEDDGAMVDILRWYKKEVLSFYSQDEPDDTTFDSRFSVAVSKNRKSLVFLLKK
ncbi:TPA: hypothetical protein HA253_07350 [Candidatus Woesearchaeota archaeon]|nr:hypothetical protein [Candidatus Woesearchaeota archaeon]